MLETDVPFIGCDVNRALPFTLFFIVIIHVCLFVFFFLFSAASCGKSRRRDKTTGYFDS